MGQLFKFKFQTGSAASRPVTGKAADSGYTAARGAAQQQANRQTVAQISKTVSNSLNQQKSINEAQRKLAQTAKLTGGANIDNSATVIKNLQQTFSGANDSSKTQLDRTLQSKQGFGQNWTSPRSSVGNAIVSAVAGSSADWLNAAGTALKSDRKSGLAVDSGRVSAQATGNEWYNRAGSYFQNKADRVQKVSNEAYTRGSSGLNDDQKLLYDTAIAGAKIVGDLAIGALTGGSATIPLAIRSFGSGAQQARQAGASENRQIAYGAVTAAKEALTEKTFDGMARLYGRAAADDLVDAFARSIAKSDGGQAVVRGTVNTLGEGLEEVISDLADPALQSLYNGRTWRDNYRNLNANELWHDGSVGVLLGGFGGSVDVAKTGYGTANEAELSAPYSDALRKMQHSTPYADALSSAETAENQAANHAVQVRYQELERKFLDGSISPKEADELWRLEGVKGRFNTVNEQESNATEELSQLKPADDTSIYLAENVGEGYTQDGNNSLRNYWDYQKNPVRQSARGLTEREIEALLAYKSGGSYLLNANLRNDIALSETEQQMVAGLDSALPKLPTYQEVLYRNIGFDDFADQKAFDDFLEQHSVGAVVAYPAYTSASTSKDGYPVEGDYVVHMIIEGRTGRDLSGYGNNSESEVLFGRRRKFEVTKITYDENGVPTIYMTEVVKNGKIE